MSFEERRACVECGSTFIARTGNRVRCDSCRAARIRERSHVLLAEQECQICGTVFKPYRSKQVTCGEASCQRKRMNNERTPARIEQMEKLFRYYRERDDIKIDSLPNGTKVMVVSDHQLPFIDQPFEDAKQRFIADWMPDITIWAGDVLDCYELSVFDKRPERLFNLEDEINMAKGLLQTYKMINPKMKQYFIFGNHEDRLERVIWRRAQEFSFMVSDLFEAMGLDDLVTGAVPYGKHVEICGFVVTHGSVVRVHSAYTAKAMIDKYRSSGASGHTHRAGSHSLSDHRGVSHTWYELGCSCIRLDYMKTHPNWQSAFLIGRIWNNAIQPTLIRVIETKDGARGFDAVGKYYRIND